MTANENNRDPDRLTKTEPRVLLAWPWCRGPEPPTSLFTLWPLSLAPTPLLAHGSNSLQKRSQSPGLFASISSGRLKCLFLSILGSDPNEEGNRHLNLAKFRSVPWSQTMDRGPNYGAMGAAAKEGGKVMPKTCLPMWREGERARGVAAGAVPPAGEEVPSGRVVRWSPQVSAVVT